MDSAEEAAQLCTTFGFEITSENGNPAVMLVKVRLGATGHEHQQQQI